MLQEIAAMESVYVKIFKEVYSSNGDWTKNLSCPETRQELNERAAIASTLFEKYCGPDEAQKYSDMVENEKRHIKLVRAVMDEIFSESSDHFEASRHDFTKDEAYIFCTLMHFRFNIKDQISEFTQPEISRHARLEPHHPEFEFQPHITWPAFTDYNLLEMCIDRLARNLQFNKGLFNAEQFSKFLPTFRNFTHPGEPDTERLNRYLAFAIVENIALVQKHYNLIFA